MDLVEQKDKKPETPNLKDFAIKETYDAINAKIESAQRRVQLGFGKQGFNEEEHQKLKK